MSDAGTGKQSVTAPRPLQVEVSGYVQDEYGEPIAGATIDLHIAGADKATETSGNSGKFWIRVYPTNLEASELSGEITASIDGCQSKAQLLTVPCAGPLQHIFTVIRIIKNGLGWRHEDPPLPESNRVVKIFFATDRSLTIDAESVTYGSTRENRDMNYGTCEVHVPLGKRRLGATEGCIPMPFRNTDLANFEEEIETTAKAGNFDAGFLFIHGFNVTFKEALRRVAQIACDTQFKGVPVLFSWPSKGEAGLYDDDVHEIPNSRRNLKLLMTRLVKNSPLKTIHIIGHSLGCRLALFALELLHESLKHQPQILKYIVFGAPDVERHDFISSVSEVGELCQGMTTYVSANDTALQLARKIFGYVRAGDCADENYVAVNKMDTIDATAVSGPSPWGHSYLFDCGAVLGDLHELVVLSLGVPRFRLDAYRTTSAGTIWKLRS